MTTKLRAVTGWISVGSSQTSPIENMKRAHVALDSYYVVIGFEVNELEAYKNDVHDLALDYGHAFFYLVKNTKIINSFSFGPWGVGKVGWFNNGEHLTYKKNGEQNARPGTADYPIREDVKAFKLAISHSQANALHKEVNSIRVEIAKGQLRYSAIMNDTCAETAKEILDEVDIVTPSGSGWVKNSHIASFPIVYAVNPYSWHDKFKKSHPEKKFTPGALGEWRPALGAADPIFGMAPANAV